MRNTCEGALGMADNDDEYERFIRAVDAILKKNNKSNLNEEK